MTLVYGLMIICSFKGRLHLTEHYIPTVISDGPRGSWLRYSAKAQIPTTSILSIVLVKFPLPSLRRTRFDLARDFLVTEAMNGELEKE
jgi:hypothetical protein